LGKWLRGALTRGLCFAGGFAQPLRFIGRRERVCFDVEGRGHDGDIVEALWLITLPR
jgi:hypothetical protein